MSQSESTATTRTTAGENMKPTDRGRLTTRALTCVISLDLKLWLFVCLCEGRKGRRKGDVGGTDGVSKFIHLITVQLHGFFCYGDDADDHRVMSAGGLKLHL